MPFTPFLRKFMLTTHITFSIGWLGAVAGFLAIAITGLTSHNPQVVRSAYLVMELVGWFVIVPCSLAALLTGVVESLGTPWGLFRYYWVSVKFFLTIAAAVILLVHMQPISRIANIALTTTLPDIELRNLRIQLVFDAAAALLVLLVLTTISVYKPWGRTTYGLRKERERGVVRKPTTGKPWGLYVLLGLIGLVMVLFIVLHLTGHGLHGH
ncbi:MAG TPA: hypothetical protein VLD19_21130 [Chitinophagaceae bacterium]|nr:hypothetical protein [Chitinophagaceae bacterium]